MKSPRAISLYHLWIAALLAFHLVVEAAPTKYKREQELLLKRTLTSNSGASVPPPPAGAPTITVAGPQPPSDSPNQDAPVKKKFSAWNLKDKLGGLRSTKSTATLTPGHADVVPGTNPTRSTFPLTANSQSQGKGGKLARFQTQLKLRSKCSIGSLKEKCLSQIQQARSSYSSLVPDLSTQPSQGRHHDSPYDSHQSSPGASISSRPASDTSSIAGSGSIHEGGSSSIPVDIQAPTGTIARPRPRLSIDADLNNAAENPSGLSPRPKRRFAPSEKPGLDAATGIQGLGKGPSGSHSSKSSVSLNSPHPGNPNMW